MQEYNEEAWRRFLARMLDSWIFFVIFMLIFSQNATHERFTIAYVICSILSTMVWVFIEPIFLSYFGATIGKWLFRIRVRDQAGNKLTYYSAFKRSVLVCVKGMALGIPIIYLLTCIKGYSDLTIYGMTAWDKINDNIVTYGSMDKMWLLFSIILPFLIFFLGPFIFLWLIFFGSALLIIFSP